MIRAYDVEYDDENLTRVVCEAEDEGKRLDAFIAEKTELTRSAVVRLIENRYVKLENNVKKELSKKYSVVIGDCFLVEIPEAQDAHIEAEDIYIDIVYEDDDIIVVNKPEGMVVHPAPGNYSGTLVNALLYHCRDGLSGIGGVIRPGIVHRIDKDTGGLLVVAKNDAAHSFLSEQIKEHKVTRIYHAIIKGNLKEDSGTVDAPIGRHPTDRKKMAVIRDTEHRSREAITHWRVLQRFNGFSHIECKLETGRTHQIRVHMASLGHALMGDTAYGGGTTPFEAKHKSLINGQCLFASTLALIHPSTGEHMEFSVELPENFQKLLFILKTENQR